MVRRVDRNGEAPIWFIKCSSYAKQKTGTNIDESVQAGENG